MPDKRVVVDCRTSPQGDGCSLSVEGTETEVLETIMPHAVSRHKMTDNDESRNAIKSLMKEVVST